MIFGITGGIAAGKSTVSEMLKKRGAVIIDADQVAREVVEPGTPGLEALRQRFGEEYILPNGQLDRKYLGQLVFGDERARHDLNAITHPLIHARMDELVEEARRKDPHAVIVLDIPLLIEGMAQTQEKRVDRVILVYVPREVQLKRLMLRDGLTPEEAEQRLDAQMPIEEKRVFADDIIDNSGTVTETEEQVNKLMDKLALLAKSGEGG